MAASPVEFGHYEDLAWAGELVDTYRAEDLPLRFVDVGIARPDDLVDRGDRGRAIRHRGDRLCAADPEDAVGSGEVASRNHRGMRRGRQARDHILAAGHLGRNDCHDRCRKQRIAPARHVAADPLDRYHPMAEMDAGQRLDVERQDRCQLCLRKRRDPVNRELRIRARLSIEARHRRCTFRGRDLDGLDLDAVEALRIIDQGRVTP